MRQSLEEAKHFLNLLDETAQQFTFQTFSDKKTNGSDPLASWLHGDISALFPQLCKLNDQGAGIFVMVNAGNGTGRNNQSVERIRCLFNENDEGLPKALPLDPHIVVESSPGKAHYYFLCDGIEKDEFTALQERLIADYGSDKSAKDVARVLRLPGFYHQKKEPHKVSIIHESSSLPYHRDVVLSSFPPVVKPKPDRSTAPVIDSSNNLIADLRSALFSLHADDYHLWIEIGMALKSMGDQGRGLWLEWSSTSESFDPVESAKKWQSFAPTTIGYKSVFHEATSRGWLNPRKKLPGDTVKKSPVSPSVAQGDTDDIDDFKLIPIRQLVENPINIKWAIKGVIEQGGVSLISGPYGSGKSFIAFDMAFCIAAGLDWQGCKGLQMPVIVLAGEGHSGIGDRFDALSRHYDLRCPENLYLSASPARINDRINAAWVKVAVDKLCPDAGVIVIDTLNRNFGDGDENSTRDMTAFISSIDDHFRSTGKTIIIIHHTGHADPQRARGNTSLPAACEGEFIVTRDKNNESIVNLSCKKQKNAKKADDMEFVFRPVDLDRVDEDGEPIGSLVLELSSRERGAKFNMLSKNDDSVLTALRMALTNFGRETPSAWRDRDEFIGIEKIVNLAHWREESKFTLEELKPRSIKDTFRRSKERLIELGLVGEYSDYCWEIKK